MCQLTFLLSPHVASEIFNRAAIAVRNSGANRGAVFRLSVDRFHGAHLNLLAVRPVWQRRGLGRRMLGWMEESARVAGISAIHLEVRASNAAGRRFYRALGFQEMALLPRYYSGREAAIWMARDLRTRAASQSGLIPPPTA